MALFTTFTAFEQPPADKLNKLSGETTTYVPALTAVGGGLSLGGAGAIAEGQIWRLGDLVDVRFLFVFGAAPAAGTGTYEISIPGSFAPVEPKVRPGQAWGLVTIEDVSVPAATSAVIYWEQSTGKVRMRRTTNDTLVASAAPQVWAAGDRIIGQFAYRTTPPA